MWGGAYVGARRLVGVGTGGVARGKAARRTIDHFAARERVRLDVRVLDDDVPAVARAQRPGPGGKRSFVILQLPDEQHELVARGGYPRADRHRGPHGEDAAVRAVREAALDAALELGVARDLDRALEGDRDGVGRERARGEARWEGAGAGRRRVRRSPRGRGSQKAQEAGRDEENTVHRKNG